jgi:hypothetical protein
MKKIVRLTESQLIKLVKNLITEVKVSDHTKNLYLSWAKKKSGNVEGAKEIMNDVFDLLKDKKIKDFSQYSSYDELKNDLDKLKNIQMEKEKSSDAERIYEDNELLVIAPKNWESSCKYGASSKWCTTSRDTSSHWERHNRTGTEFFWIFKNKPDSDPEHKYSYHIKFAGGSDWCNAINQCGSSYLMLPESAIIKHPKYDEIIKRCNDYHNKRVNNREIQKENTQYIRKLLVENKFEVSDVLDEKNLEKNLNNIIDKNKDYIEEKIKEYRLDTGQYGNYDDEEEYYDYDDYEKPIEYTFDSIKNDIKSLVIKDFLYDANFYMGDDLIYMFKNIIMKKYNLTEDVLLKQQKNIDYNFNELFNEIPKNDLDEVLMEKLTEIATDALTTLPGIGEYF